MVKKRPSGKSTNGERYDSDSFNKINSNNNNKNNGYDNGYRDDSDRNREQNRSRDGDRRDRLLNKVTLLFFNLKNIIILLINFIIR